MSNISHSYNYFPFQGKTYPTFSWHEVSNLQVSSRASDVSHGWCRFTYSLKLSFTDQDQVRGWLAQAVFQRFPTCRTTPHIMFPAPIRRQRYVDINMDDVGVPNHNWTAAVAFNLPNNAKVRFYGRGSNLLRHIMIMSIAKLESTEILDKVCQSLADNLYQARIVDVWRQVYGRGALAGAFSGTLFFVVELLDATAIDPVIKQDIHRGRWYDNIHKMMQWGDFACSPATAPSHFITLQPGWILLTAGHHLKVLFEKRPDWCTICRASAQSFHTRKDCPFFICHRCNEQGHYKDSAVCSKYPDKRKGSGKS